MMLVLICQLDTIWEESLSEEVSKPDWLVDMLMGNYLEYISRC